MLLIVFPTLVNPKEKYQGGISLLVMLEKLLFSGDRSIWINLNSPRTHIVADIMRRTRATYHYKIRKLKKDREKLQKEAMAKAITSVMD